MEPLLEQGVAAVVVSVGVVLRIQERVQPRASRVFCTLRPASLSPPLSISTADLPSGTHRPILAGHWM
jgi:hypothetical protein